MNKEKHWTERSAEDFVQRITFDFATQIDKALEQSGSSQAELAKTLGVSEGRVSQVLNNPGNLGLNSVVKYARAIGRKIAIVLYDDRDTANNNGPVNSEIFSTCWERAGRPVDFFALRSDVTRGFVQASEVVLYWSDYPFTTSGYNSTLPSASFWSPISAARLGPPMLTAPVNLSSNDCLATTGEQGQLQYAD